ncbi:MAG TPA: M48 family metallopeptidase [Gemmatimonadaceae bacterium]|nr:M48 family metallopeptidase [Gemmatimonadaceae bacterium]
MTDQQLAALVRRLEPIAAASPRAYRLRVIALALLGYAYIGAVLLLLIAALAGCVLLLASGSGGAYFVGKVGFIVLALAWMIARSLWVRFEPPTGRRLAREEAPALFAEAESLRRALDAPRAHRVLLDDQFNAAVAQVPRLGMLGWPRNYLVIGMPLLEALPAEQVRAVLAHEFAHLSRAHGRLGAWIYRVRVTWYQLMQRLDESRHHGAALFRRFFDWYAPYFGAYTFVLARWHEYEADRLAADIVGARTMAQTLVDLRARGEFLGERFWPAVWAGTSCGEPAPEDVYLRLASATREPVPDAELARWHAAVLKLRTDSGDTHPAPRDRLAALVGPVDAAGRLADGSELRPSPAFAATAAEHYLGASHERLAAEIGAVWRREVEEGWRARVEGGRAAREGLAALAAKAGAGGLTMEERWREAEWREEVHGAGAALPLYEALLRDDPGHLSALFACGRILLGRGEERGIALIEQTMARDHDATLAGCEIIAGWLTAEGRLEEAERWRERGREKARLMREAHRERVYITASDRYEPPALAPEAVEAIVRQLDGIQGVRSAYLARKVVRHLADEAPHHVLAIIAAAPAWTLRPVRAQLERGWEIAARLELPDEVTAFACAARAEYLRPLQKVKEARIYDARERKAERAAAVKLAPA